MTPILTIVAAALALWPQWAGAQLDAPTAPQAVLRIAEREEWAVRVTSAAGVAIEGRVRTVDDRAVLVEDTRIELADVVRIERGERVGEGGRTGMLAGGILGGTLFVLVSQAISDDDVELSVVGPVAIAGIVAGGILGGLVGSDLDPPRIEWLQVWPAGGW